MKQFNPNKRRAMIGATVVLALTAVGAGHSVSAARASRAAQKEADRKVRVAMAQVLPQMNGGQLKTTLVEVTYAPGAASTPHSHPCPVIGYVVSGELRTQVKGGTEATYKAGETFYEPPNGVHLVSANGSRTDPTKLLAIFICDHEAELSTPVRVENDKGSH